MFRKWIWKQVRRRNVSFIAFQSNLYLAFSHFILGNKTILLYMWLEI